jgi:hypothetical protein
MSQGLAGPAGELMVVASCLSLGVVVVVLLVVQPLLTVAVVAPGVLSFGSGRTLPGGSGSR